MECVYFLISYVVLAICGGFLFHLTMYNFKRRSWFPCGVSFICMLNIVLGMFILVLREFGVVI